MLKRMKLGKSNLEVSRIALGCMRLSDDLKQAMKTVQAALDAGINFFDHADIYGNGAREEVFSHLWESSPSLRAELILQSKCGIRLPGNPEPDSPGRYDFSYEHIVNSVEGSLRRLKTDYLDVLLLHRPDPLVEPEEVARAFDHLHESGKVRWFGVSNHTAAQIQLLQTAVNQPLVTNQVQLSVVHSQLLNDGVVFNTDDMGVQSRSEGTIEFCRMGNITIQVWGPLAAGAVSGTQVDRSNPRDRFTADLIAEMANKRRVSPGAILIAWLLRHPAGIQAIIGTTNPERIAEACKADEIELSREEWYRLFTAGRGGGVP